MLEKLIALFRRNKPVRKTMIKERLMKILFNPITEKQMWVKFNPAKRTWEWLEEALPIEVDLYQNSVFSELQGMEILSYRERKFEFKEGENNG